MKRKHSIRLRLIPKVIGSLLLFLSAPPSWGVLVHRDEPSRQAKSCTIVCAVLKWLREYIYRKKTEPYQIADWTSINQLSSEHDTMPAVVIAISTPRLSFINQMISCCCNQETQKGNEKLRRLDRIELLLAAKRSILGRHVLVKRNR